MCGGTRKSRVQRRSGEGLSPRVRGNRCRCLRYPLECRTIPACAGEPSRIIKWQTGMKDYPRVCGGTSLLSLDFHCEIGLSPRVRGNPQRTGTMAQKRRTIPACAGEPGSYLMLYRGISDYPRVCGGTSLLSLDFHCEIGLSPRVRGNPQRTGTMAQKRRTIPACAGEPTADGHNGTEETDYPRVCGGTVGTHTPDTRFLGLSPRVRGNRSLKRNTICALGTIPACAGEPGLTAESAHRAGDYPRVCGGTWIVSHAVPRNIGLSPRVRGNPCL